MGLGIPWRCINPSVLISVHCMATNAYKRTINLKLIHVGQLLEFKPRIIEGLICYYSICWAWTTDFICLRMDLEDWTNMFHRSFHVLSQMTALCLKLCHLKYIDTWLTGLMEKGAWSSVGFSTYRKFLILLLLSEKNECKDEDKVMWYSVKE